MTLTRPAPEAPVPAPPALSLAESTERAGWSDLFEAAGPAWAARHGLASEVADDGSLALRLRDLPLPMFNRVLGPCRLPDAAWLAQMHAFYAAVPAGVWMLQPDAPCDPRLMASALDSHSRVHRWQRGERRWIQTGALLAEVAGPVIARHGHPPLGDFEVHELGAGAGADFAAPLVDAMGLPPWMAGWWSRLPGRAGWRCYVACAAGQPVAAGAMHLHDGQAWLGLAATRPAWRCRGAHRALLQRRLHDAFMSGARSVFAETAEPAADRRNPAVDNLTACGLRMLGWRDSWCQRD